MTLPESTPTQFSCCGVQFLYGTVPGGVVGALVVPAAVDDANPGAGEDSHGVGVVVSARAGSVVDVGCPSAFALVEEKAHADDAGMGGLGVVITGSVVTAGAARTLYKKDPA